MATPIIRHLLLAFFTSGFFISQAYAQCALCRQTLKSGGSEGLIRGFYWSIVLIGAIPLLIFCSAVLLYRRWEKKTRANDLAQNALKNA